MYKVYIMSVFSKFDKRKKSWKIAFQLLFTLLRSYLLL